ncbi:hypothetical protein C8J56DRAFT_880505 [Mycena floridula]|nr:hypothetical protein C8J56DRAFT_880505 [Mycena floridula]
MPPIASETVFPMSRISSQNTTFAYGVGILGTGVLSLISLYSVKIWEFCRRTVSRRPVPQPDPIVNPLAQTEESEAEINSLRLSLSAAQARVKAQQAELAQAKEELDQAKQHSAGLDIDLLGSQAEKDALEDRVAAQMKEMDLWKEDVERMKLLLNQTAEMLKTRTTELEAVQLFLPKPDELSGNDVMKLVEALNLEILHTAATMAETFHFEEKSRDQDDSQEMQEACEHIAEILGQRMTVLLRDSQHHDDPILIQMTLQAAMCAYADWYITSWFFHDRESERLLNDLYERLRESGDDPEEQGISSRWRVLTRTYVQHLFDEPPDMTEYFLDAFVNILITAGVKDTEGHLRETVLENFGDHITRITASSIHLNRVVGVSVTTCELLTLYVNKKAPDALFDKSSMDDAFGRDETKKVAGKEGEWDKFILLKPKVVLESRLTEGGSPVEELSSDSDGAIQ